MWRIRRKEVVRKNITSYMKWFLKKENIIKEFEISGFDVTQNSALKWKNNVKFIENINNIFYLVKIEVNWENNLVCKKNNL